MTYRVYPRDSGGYVKLSSDVTNKKTLQDFLNSLPLNERPIFINDKEVVVQVD